MPQTEGVNHVRGQPNPKGAELSAVTLGLCSRWEDAGRDGITVAWLDCKYWKTIVIQRDSGVQVFTNPNSLLEFARCVER